MKEYVVIATLLTDDAQLFCNRIKEGCRPVGSGVPRESYCCYCGFGSLDGGTIPLVRM